MNKNILTIQNCNHVIIFGAGHGIGLGLVRELIEKCPSIKIIATFRDENKAKDLIKLSKNNQYLSIFKLDPLNEEELSQFIKDIDINEVHLVINSIGILHHENLNPEKSLKDIDLKQLTQVFQVNSFITPIIAKSITNLLPKKSPSCFVTISAKIGSIQDNKIGGWYAYRASKAALNMFLKNISIEWKRKKIPTTVLAIHPGTTITELSKPFIKNTPYKLHTTKETAQNILDVIFDENLQVSGSFISWNKQIIPW